MQVDVQLLQKYDLLNSEKLFPEEIYYIAVLWIRSLNPESKNEMIHKKKKLRSGGFSWSLVVLHASLGRNLSRLLLKFS
jgi:hypothetical protein